MINMTVFIVMENGCEYNIPLFVAHTKTGAERKIEQIITRHQELQALAKELRKKTDEYEDFHPTPDEPDLVSLPPRDLVWLDSEWQNAYRVEHHKEFMRVLDLHHIFSVQQKDLLVSQGKCSAQEAQDIEDHIYDRRYTIEEVESD